MFIIGVVRSILQATCTAPGGGCGGCGSCGGCGGSLAGEGTWPARDSWDWQWSTEVIPTFYSGKYGESYITTLGCHFIYACLYIRIFMWNPSRTRSNQFYIPPSCHIIWPLKGKGMPSFGQEGDTHKVVGTYADFHLGIAVIFRLVLHTNLIIHKSP